MQDVKFCTHLDYLQNSVVSKYEALVAAHIYTDSTRIRDYVMLIAGPRTLHRVCATSCL